MSLEKSHDPSRVSGTITEAQDRNAEVVDANGIVINIASGHVQEVNRNFSLLSLIAQGCVTGAMWCAFGGSVQIAIYNGGPPGVIYEFIAASVAYTPIYLGLAELASAVPTSAGVYHWASISAGPRYGKLCGFLAGWWNVLAWTVGCASICAILSNIVLSMYAFYHSDYVYARWQFFIVYCIIGWSSCLLVAFANRALPLISKIGFVSVLFGALTTILVLVIVPGTAGNGYATNASVWTVWDNQIGYKSDGFVFLLGMLNGAFVVGTPDVVTHLCEEIPNPRVNVPRAMLFQLGVGVIVAFGYIVALFYSISDVTAISTAEVPFPVAIFYQQATNSRAGAIGLLVLLLVPLWACLIGCCITTGRMFWTLGRDNAMPFSKVIGKIERKSQSPRNANLLTGALITVLGLIYLGNALAFNAFAGSFIVLSTASYLAALLPNLINRGKYISTPGPFYMGDIIGYLVNGAACAYIIVFIVIYCFPFAMPLTLQTMNYACVISGGSTVFVVLWYFWKRGRGYEGPVVMRGVAIDFGSGGQEAGIGDRDVVEEKSGFGNGAIEIGSGV